MRTLLMSTLAAAFLAFGAPLSLDAQAFGGSLAVVDDAIVIGEPDNSLRAGKVYIYRKDDDGTWAEAARLTGGDSEPGDGFGAALATDGHRLLVRAAEQNDGRGVVLLFHREGTGDWEEVARIESPEVEEGDGFGRALALHGDLALVGAPEHGEGGGAVLVYEAETDGGWSHTQTLTAPEGQEDDLFGAALALGDRGLLVGAPGRSERAGTTFAFARDDQNGEWTLTGELTVPGLQSNSRFGAGIALMAEEAVITAPTFDGGYGAAFVFTQNDEGGWSQSGRLVAFDGQRQDNFGTAVAAHGDEVWVGSPRAAGSAGAAYGFRLGEELWSAVRRMHSRDAGPGDRFGGSVAVFGELAAAGLVGADNSAGRVAIFERDEAGQWQEAAVVHSEPEALPVVAGETLECEEGEAGLNPCSNVEVLAFLPVKDIGGDRGIRLNDVWGWQDPETGREFALVGRTDGLAFVDISDRNNPVFVGDMMKTEGSPTAAWRDMKVYENHAFVVADASGQHGMQVFDLTRLRDFAGEPISFDPDLTYDRIHSAHNIVMNEETGYAFVVGASAGGETCGGGLHMIDVSEPLNPTFVGCFSDPQTGRASTGYTHDAQCVIYRGPDEEYQGREICFGANETALSIADITDKENPVALSRAAYPNVGYTHQVWLTEDHEYLYMNDELDVLSGMVDNTRTIIWDVRDLDDPQVAGEYFAPVSASAHNLYIVDHLMYQSNYASGLRIVDISDRDNPQEVGYLDTAPFAEPEPGFTGSWSNFPFFEDGTVAVTSIQEGLYLVRYAPPVPVS